MGAREEIQKRIEKKRAEMQSLGSQILALKTQEREAASYIQALEDILKILPKEAGEESTSSLHTLRPGSAVERVREVLEKAGRPLHITDILTALDKPHDSKTRAGLSGSISSYARAGKIFTRPSPNTFGLIGMASPLRVPHHGQRSTGGPPPDFGLDDSLEEPDLEQNVG